MAEVHLIESRARALRLFAVSSAVYPSEWASQQVVEPTLIDVSDFAFHARRVNDLCGYKARSFPDVNAVRYKFSAGQNISLVEDYRDALNRIHHARELVFNWAIWEGASIFTSSAKNLVASYLRVETDQREPANISIFGLAFCFLVCVLPAVKADFPDYRF
jgi:hypothetical protein